MRDLREIYAEMEIKVSDPVVSFCETIIDISTCKCFAETPNKRNKLHLICRPLEKKIADEIESGFISVESLEKQQDHQSPELSKLLHKWDLLSAKRIWALGPDSGGSNVFINYTISYEVDQKLLTTIKKYIVQGFCWGVKEGPLCDEPIRNVEFRLLDAQICQEPAFRNGTQIIPTTRRCCFCAFLLGTPRLMQPVYHLEITTPADGITAIYNILSKRRGHVTSDFPKPGTPIFIVKAFIPVIESFGFETDVRYHTLGQAFCLSTFDHWSIVPGDPLDKSVTFRPFEQVPPQALAREFIIKTRRRKGMKEEVSVNKFFDDSMLAQLAGQDELILENLK
eukprot:gnl/TRDRNA2_/TRDRNA2_177955_c0_seq5.p1 gnl/TRDRNA2_/TRDRNA2_177955_c0~~gnl/TRDRNA2_/TRDRNA2_177955_c0_seq5.p1  ORF type:complete len:338 (-),score=-8.10 gnl/TRDRNA2_/TRDRNA2_177955_c0_seq5:937-1950(-)